MAPLCLTLLGGFDARQDTGATVRFPRKKAQALLAYLALRPGQAHPRDKLAALLWGDASDERARQSLRQGLSALRRGLGRGRRLLLMEGETVTLSPEAVDVDAAVFGRLVADGTPEALERAVMLYRGDLLEGLGVGEPPFEEWLLAERERLRELVMEALAKLAAHHARAGAIESAIRAAGRLVALDPLQEAAHRTLMRLYARQDRRGAALRQYQVCVSALERELGAEPEDETRRLYQDILLTPPDPPSRAPRTQGGPDPVVAEAPLIGREAHAARLQQAREAAWGGRGQVAVVLGEAGIGKSRLVETLIADALAHQGRVLLGRAYETDQTLPFGPWLDALRTARVVQELQERGRLGPARRAELARLFPELGDPPLHAPEDHVPLFEAIAAALRALAERQPLVVVLEDLHWCDETSLRLLAFLARRVATWPVCLVGTARDEELAEVPALGRLLDEPELARRLVRLVLPPLGRSAIATLVRALSRAGTAEALARQLEERVWQASEGNPFVAVESVRALQEGAAAAVTATLPVPQRVRHIIAGRLERLGGRSRQLAAVAAVIGREFDFALLASAAGLDAREVAQGVEELVGRRVLHAVGQRLDFTHDRIREVAHGRLLPAQRQVLHGAVARALEDLYADDLAPHYLALGLHYRESAVWERTALYLEHAGEVAARRGAHREAVTCFEQALDALEQLPASPALMEQAINLHVDVRQSCVPLGDHRRVVAHLDKAEAASRALGNEHELGWILAFRAHSLLWTGEPDRAIESGRRALDIARALDDVQLLVSASTYLSWICFWLGDYGEGADLARHTVESLEAEQARRGNVPTQEVFSRTWLAWCLAELGQLAEGIRRGEEAVRMAESRDSAYELVHACLGVGLAYLRLGAIDQAVGAAARGVELCRERDFPWLWVPAAAILGIAYALAGRLDEGLSLLERVEEVTAGQMGGPGAMAFLGEAYLLAGRRDAAQARAGRALRLAVERKERGWQAWALRLLGEIASRGAPPEIEDAEDHFRQAIALSADLGMRPLGAHCHLGLGSLYRRVGDGGKAQEHLTIAATMYREMGMALWLEQAERALDARG